MLLIDCDDDDDNNDDKRVPLNIQFCSSVEQQCICGTVVHFIPASSAVHFCTHAELTSGGMLWLAVTAAACTHVVYAN